MSRPLAVATPMLLALTGCAASITDVFPEVSVYNSMFTPIRIEAEVEGMRPQSFRLQRLTGRIISPGDECRSATVRATTMDGEPIGVFEGSVCAKQGLVVSEDGITLED